MNLRREVAMSKLLGSSVLRTPAGQKIGVRCDTCKMSLYFWEDDHAVEVWACHRCTGIWKLIHKVRALLGLR
jgi:hypothetical protein